MEQDNTRLKHGYLMVEEKQDAAEQQQQHCQFHSGPHLLPGRRQGQQSMHRTDISLLFLLRWSGVLGLEAIIQGLLDNFPPCPKAHPGEYDDVIVACWMKRCMLACCNFSSRW